MTGIIYFVGYAANIFSEVSKDFYTQNVIVLIAYIYIFIVSLIGLGINNKFGKKIFLQVGYFLIFILLILISVVYNLDVNNNNLYKCMYVATIFVYYTVYNISVGPVTAVVT